MLKQMFRTLVVLDYFSVCLGEIYLDMVSTSSLYSDECCLGILEVLVSYIIQPYDNNTCISYYN